MGTTFSTTFTREQLNAAAAGVQLDGETLAQADTQQIVSWLSRLHLLYGLPFNYLVPDIRMLPNESIRFFKLDQNWIEALIDGAYSLGTTAATGMLSEAMLPQIREAVQNNLPAVRAAILGLNAETLEPGEITGFFLRSDAVSGWPGLEVTGFATAYNSGGNWQYEDPPLQLLRLERLSPSLLFGLFAGSLKALRLRQPAETLHFAFDPSPGENNDSSYMKRYRYVNSGNGIQAGQLSGSGVFVGFRNGQTDRRVVNIHTLAQGLSNGVWAPGTSPGQFTSAQFGLAMVQITDQASFVIQ